VDDAEIVAAIAAGELDGLAAALDRYAVSLFEYCHSMAPEAAVDAVHDTFIVAWCKLAGLRDPGKLCSWLETVAGNECFRHTLIDGEPDQDQTQTRPVEVAGPAEMPPGLPGRVISECADETPAGRAPRVWVTNRAGPFDRDGFPAAHLGRRRYLAGRRRLAVAAAALAVLALAGAASAALMSPGSPRHDAATTTEPGTGTGASGAAAPGASLPTTPASPITPTASQQRHRTAPSGTSQSATPRGPAQPGTRTGQTAASPPVVMLATMPPSAMPPTPPPAAQGVIAVNPPQLTLVLGGGGPAKTFQLTAEHGPVNGYTITVPPNLPGTLLVSPSSGSLAAGASARITVTAVSAVPFTADLTVYPGDILVQVTVQVHQAKDN
jgi:hypothetical protein